MHPTNDVRTGTSNTLLTYCSCESTRRDRHHPRLHLHHESLTGLVRTSVKFFPSVFPSRVLEVWRTLSHHSRVGPFSFKEAATECVHQLGVLSLVIRALGIGQAPSQTRHQTIRWRRRSLHSRTRALHTQHGQCPNSVVDADQHYTVVHTALLSTPSGRRQDR